MRDHVRILGWCFIVYSAIVALVGMEIGAIVFFGGVISGDHQARFITGAVGSAIACFLIIISLPGIFAGLGLLKMRPWARIVAIVVGVLHILSFPLGTALGVYTLWVLLNAETEAMFRGQTTVAVATS
ncbi:MAG: hypothetical protein QOE82_3408 [Thermoanaerobaculia bacterium]|jgi:hypothetical protein|nr:hypothetical protein [Thermoanaerobaculia bacterium]